MNWNVFSRVFRNARYTQLAIVVALIVLSAALLLPNYDLLVQVYTSDSLSITEKISFIGVMHGRLFSNFSVLSAIATVSTSILFGINVALMVYYIRRRQSAVTNKTAEWSSLGGMISGVLGVGCAACGSVVLSAVLSAVGAGGLLALLPLHGAEFGLLSIILLLISIKYLAKRIDDPLVCPSNYFPRP